MQKTRAVSLPYDLSVMVQVGWRNFADPGGRRLLPPVALLCPGHVPMAAPCPDAPARDAILILYLTRSWVMSEA